jgi:GNAT superfamily N-acetyltransferase
MPTLIVAERPDTADATTLIRELDGYLEPLYPQESRHGFSIEQLLREAVAFFVMRHDGIPAGCGGVKLFGTAYGEIKRMYVRSPFRGLGLGKLMLQHLADWLSAHSTVWGLQRRPAQRVLRETPHVMRGWAYRSYGGFAAFFCSVAPFPICHSTKRSGQWPDVLLLSWLAPFLLLAC